MSKLVIVESPTKAGTIGKYLGKDYKVTATKGHVRDLHKGALSVDIENGFVPQYTVMKDKQKVVDELKELAASSEEIYLATDPDREGEAISFHIATLLGLDMKTAKRVKFNEINKAGIEKGMSSPSGIDMDLVDAYQARRILDRLVGYKLSPFVSQKIRRGLSAGRVQSVAVRLIVDREDEIRAFKPEEFWTITASLCPRGTQRAIKANLISDEGGKVKITNEEGATAYTQRLENAVYTISKIEKGKRRKQPQPPFTTSTLQQDASHKLGFASKRTMRVAQELYEGVKIEGREAAGLITYMRTDSLRISDESRQAGMDYIRNTYGEKYLPKKPRIFKQKGRIQDGHEAIRPTDLTITPQMARSSLSLDQYKLYNLIWNRFLASLMECSVENTVKVRINAETQGYEGACELSASGYSVAFDGYTVLYKSQDDEEEKENSSIPDNLSIGDALRLKKLDPEQHFTQPPARYTEASLIKTLEETGIGRPSTYSSIISKILEREYVEREKKTLKPTELGEVVTSLLKEYFPKIVDTKFTSDMESNLDKVEAGELNYVKMLEVFYDDFSKSLSAAKENTQGLKLTLESDVTDEICEKCGRNMVIKVGRYGKFLACPGYPECRNSKPLIVNVPGTCPMCGGPLVERHSKKGSKFFGCSAYPECTFATWDTPTAELCPSCGKTLFKSRYGVVKCLAEGCGYERKSAKKSKPKAKEENESE